MNNFRILREEDYSTSSWSGGTTTEIYIYPEDSNYKDMDFKFRISSATVDLDESTFTQLEGTKRFITPLDGKLKLTHDEEDYIELDAFDIYEFPGDIDTKSYGKVRDFNLMIREDAIGNLESIEIKEDSINLKKDHSYLLFNYDGDIKVEDINLKPMESLLIENTGTIKIKSEEAKKILLAELKI